MMFLKFGQISSISIKLKITPYMGRHTISQKVGQWKCGREIVVSGWLVLQYTGRFSLAECFGSSVMKITIS